ncbi:DUF5425 family lipoprotein [Borreliella turdi]|uniref:DUF5425 family lipoprotein n=1 Tax=Borreliella turdi TaxID=57863 RepID=UPI00124736C1|nr:DUF5425 family lipoprotein [Borreliella turdi]
MYKKHIAFFLYKIIVFLLILGCDLPKNAVQNKMNDISNLEKNYMDDPDYKCLNKKESTEFKDFRRLDNNNIRDRSYSGRITNVSNSNSKTRTVCKTRN